MSGGSWNYQQYKLEGGEIPVWMIPDLLTFLAAVEGELDWGEACDTCSRCARRRVGPAMVKFFDYWFGSDSDATLEEAVAIMKDDSKNCCEECAVRWPKRHEVMP